MVDSQNQVTAISPIATNYGTIQNEFSPARSNVRGTVAMAKGNDPNSATSQWFVNIVDNSANLDNQNGGFTVFGQVIGEGIRLVDKANSLQPYNLNEFYYPNYDPQNPTDGPFSEVPLFNYAPDASNFVTITSATVVPATAWKGGSSSDKSNWGLAANWNPNSGVPDGAGISLSFGSKSSVNNVVDMTSSGRTVGNLYFSATTGTIIKSSSNYALTLDNNGHASTIGVAGEHTIGTPVVLNNDLNISGTGTLNLSGGVSGSHGMDILSGTVTAKSVQLHGLYIGSGAKLVIQADAAATEWKGGNSSGPANWGLAANWNPSGVPDGAGVNLTLGGQSSASNVVDLSSTSRTVSNIYFSPTTGTIIQNSGGASLKMDNGDNASTISVLGAHTISAPVVLNNDLSISGTGTLNLSGGVSGSHGMDILSGTVTAKSVQLHGLYIGSGAKLVIQADAAAMEWKGGNSAGPNKWGLAANWNPNTGVPDGAGINLILGAQSSASILDMNSTGRTVSNIYFSPTVSTLIQGAGVSLKLDNGGNTSTISVLGSHTISTPVIINNDLLISGTGTLDLSGGISGSHGMDILNGTVTARSVRLNGLYIGSGAKLAISAVTGSGLEDEITLIPEPATLQLLVIGVLGLLAWGRRIPHRK